MSKKQRRDGCDESKLGWKLTHEDEKLVAYAKAHVHPGVSRITRLSAAIRDRRGAIAVVRSAHIRDGWVAGLPGRTVFTQEDSKAGFGREAAAKLKLQIVLRYGVHREGRNANDRTGF
jgi:hypothetical protein